MSQGRGRRTLTKGFKVEAVQLSQQPGMSVVKAATDLGMSENTLYRWRTEQQEDGDEAFRGHGRLRSDPAELARLRYENIGGAYRDRHWHAQPHRMWKIRIAPPNPEKRGPPNHVKI